MTTRSSARAPLSEEDGNRKRRVRLSHAGVLQGRMGRNLRIRETARSWAPLQRVRNRLVAPQNSTRAAVTRSTSHETEPRSGVLRCVSHVHSNARRPATRAWRDRTVVSRSEPTVENIPPGSWTSGGRLCGALGTRSGSDRAPRLGPRHLFWRPRGCSRLAIGARKPSVGLLGPRVFRNHPPD